MKSGPAKHVDTGPPLGLDDEQIRQLIDGRKSINKISEELDIPKTTLLRYLRKKGIVLNSNKEKLNWSKIIDHIRDVDLPFYVSIGEYPSVSSKMMRHSQKKNCGF